MEEEKIICPICGKYEFDDEYGICPHCFWENDSYQLENADESGANILSLNNYKKWWNALEEIMPKMFKKYEIKQGKNNCWKYDDLIVPRKNIKAFISEMTNYNIALRANFYFVCQQNNFDRYTFVGFPLISSNNTKVINDEILNIIFSNNPIEVCKKYQMVQILSLLNDSENANKMWATITPHIDVQPNPVTLPTI